MREKVEEKIEVLLDRIVMTTDSNDALKYTQAALNIAHCLSTLEDAKKKENQ